MAVTATTHNSLVAEHHLLQPVRSSVAVVARGGHGEMPAGFASCGETVVTGLARTQGQANVAERRWNPNRRVVATVAAGDRKYMAVGFGHCAHAVAFHMTSRAFARRAAIYALNVAIAAPRRGVGTGQVESCFYVIEINWIDVRLGWLHLRERTLKCGQEKYE